MVTKIIYDDSIDQNLIKSKKVTVIGFGSQGHAHALNLHESGVDVTVGLRESSESFKRASDMGLKVENVQDATSGADVVMLLLPDQLMADIYNSDIAPHMKDGSTLLFAHGFNIHFGEIVPREDISIGMVAPKGPGHLLRRTYEEDSGMPCLVAVDKDVSGNTFELALSYSSAIGGGKAGILKTTFKEETETDLFGEQAVLCGGMTALIKAGYDTLVEAGYSPEMAYFECLHETKLIVDLIHEGGIANMHYSISNTAEFGDYVSGPEIITNDTKNAMRGILERIQTGEFADKFLNDCRQSNDGSGGPIMKEERKSTASHSIEKVGSELRSKMKFLNSERLVNKDKN